MTTRYVALLREPDFEHPAACRGGRERVTLIRTAFCRPSLLASEALTQRSSIPQKLAQPALRPDSRSSCSGDQTPTVVTPRRRGDPEKREGSRSDWSPDTVVAACSAAS
jgi:hypothetical protein